MRRKQLWKVVAAAFMAQAMVFSAGLPGGAAQVKAQEEAPAEEPAEAPAEESAEAPAEEPAEAPAEESADQASQKQRIIITQDAEVDDMNSLVHTLLYANDFEIQGIVQTSSQFHWSGDGEEEPSRWPGTQWMNEFLDAYGEVYDNLSVHSDGYPTVDELRSITKVGNVKAMGEMEEVTEGSELIKERILDEDERTLNIAVGGGANTVARALKSIEEEYKDTDSWDEIYEKICGKVVLRAWGQQDNTYKEYISVVWPGIPMIDISGVSSPYGYGWASTGGSGLSEAAKAKYKGDWMYENIDNGHGPLLDKYVTWGDGTYLEGEEEGSQFGTNEAMVDSLDWWGGQWMGLKYSRYDFLSEGDTPDWMCMIDTGLRSLEDPSYGGWGGRTVQTSFEGSEDAVYYEQAAGERSMGYFGEEIQDDFAARADWCVAEKFEDANHAPVVSVEEGLDLEAAPGETVTLHAKAEDPDGDNVTFKWWQYAKADTYAEPANENGETQSIAIEGADTAQASFTVPGDAKSGDTIHIILEGEDDGEHTLTRYQRVIVTVK